MSLLSDYEQRTAWKYDPIEGSFHTGAGLERKINPDGSFAHFPGSTMVFRPGKQCIRIIRLMREVLYSRLEGTGMPAAFLPAYETHMTLHDLVSPETDRPEPADEYRRTVSDSIFRAAAIAEGIRKDFGGRTITMVSDRIVNMVSKSLVLLLKPRTEEDYRLLLEMYHRFDSVQRLPYPLTPHITLAYFRPGVLDGGRLGEAVDFAQIYPENAPVFEFDTESVTVRSFLDMQTYMDIPQRICFCCDGGMNRSVMAAQVMNHLAEGRNLPVECEARSAFSNTQGHPVPDRVREVLEKNGIRADRVFPTARYLEDREVSHFSDFAPISAGAAGRIMRLGLPEDRTRVMNRFFFGVPDPEYGAVSYEQVFADILERAGRCLDALETEYARHLRQ